MPVVWCWRWCCAAGIFWRKCGGGGNLVNQGGRVPPGVPGQPMTNFGIWLRRLLTGGEANSPYRA